MRFQTTLSAPLRNLSLSAILAAAVTTCAASSCAANGARSSAWTGGALGEGASFAFADAHGGRSSLRFADGDLVLAFGEAEAVFHDAATSGALPFRVDAGETWTFSLPAGDVRWTGPELEVGARRYALDGARRLVFDGRGLFDESAGDTAPAGQRSGQAPS